MVDWNTYKGILIIHVWTNLAFVNKKMGFRNNKNCPDFLISLSASDSIMRALNFCITSAKTTQQCQINCSHFSNTIKQMFNIGQSHFCLVYRNHKILKNAVRIYSAAKTFSVLPSQ